jgi:hypothetical protein
VELMAAIAASVGEVGLTTGVVLLLSRRMRIPFRIHALGYSLRLDGSCSILLCCEVLEGLTDSLNVNRAGRQP